MSNTKSLKWVWRGSALGVLGIGWLFILVQNSFHITAPVIYICLAYLAAISAIYALFRMGASAVEQDVVDDPESWGLPQSARDELEREKRTLLKAIKEAEFDHQMGKLNKRDLDEMVRTYRLRAIDVIKLLEGTGGSVRDQIRREVKARAEVADMHEKIERAHKGLAKRKNPARAAAAAQAAARVAATQGASAAVVSAAAQAAAAATDLEEEAAAKAEEEIQAAANNDKAQDKANEAKAKADDDTKAADAKATAADTMLAKPDEPDEKAKEATP